MQAVLYQVIRPSESVAYTGAVNLLLDITADQQRHYFLEQARRCRRLVGAVNDLQTIRSLERMAIEYEAKALALTSVV